MEGERRRPGQTFSMKAFASAIPTPAIVRERARYGSIPDPSWSTHSPSRPDGSRPEPAFLAARKTK